MFSVWYCTSGQELAIHRKFSSFIYHVRVQNFSKGKIYHSYHFTDNFTNLCSALKQCNVMDDDRNLLLGLRITSAPVHQPGWHDWTVPWMPFPIRLGFFIRCFALDSTLLTEGSNLVPLVTSLRIMWLNSLAYWAGISATPRKVKNASGSHYSHVHRKC